MWQETPNSETLPARGHISKQQMTTNTSALTESQLISFYGVSALLKIFNKNLMWKKKQLFPNICVPIISGAAHTLIK